VKTLAGFLPTGFLAKRDLKRASAPDTDQPLGANAAVRSSAGGERFREVSAYSTVCPEFACWVG
jgi:hypothetical protein